MMPVSSETRNTIRWTMGDGTIILSTTKGVDSEEDFGILNRALEDADKNGWEPSGGITNYRVEGRNRFCVLLTKKKVAAY